MPVHIRQSPVTAAVPIGELLVVETHLVKDGGVDVMDVERVRHGGVAEFVGFAEGYAAFKSAASHEDRVPVHMVVAASCGADFRSVGGAAHFPGPEDNGVFQKAALSEVGNQGGDGLVGDAGVFFVILLQETVLVPRRVVAVETRAGDFDKTHACFHEPPRAQCLRGVKALVLIGGVEAVEFADVLGLAANVGQFGHGPLHEEGGLVIGDDALDGLGIGALRSELCILRGEQREFASLDGGRVRRCDVVHGHAFGPHHRGLMTGGKKRAAEVFQSAIGHPVVVEHYVAGKVLIFGAEPVGHPCAETRGLADDAPSVEQKILLPVQWQLADHGAHDAEMVRHVGEVRKKFAHPQAALPALLELPRAAKPHAARIRL